MISRPGFVFVEVVRNCQIQECMAEVFTRRAVTSGDIDTALDAKIGTLASGEPYYWLARLVNDQGKEQFIPLPIYAAEEGAFGVYTSEYRHLQLYMLQMWGEKEVVASKP